MSGDRDNEGVAGLDRLVAGQLLRRETIAIRSPGLDKNIGYVWVPIELAEPGNELELELPDGSRRAATTASLPFVDPKKRKPAA